MVLGILGSKLAVKLLIEYSGLLGLWKSGIPGFFQVFQVIF
jgi:hypothetical protein